MNIQRNESENSLVAKLWAGMKVKELAVFADQNKKELLNVARKYGIVTPGASILVLSDLDAVRGLASLLVYFLSCVCVGTYIFMQYLKHGIEPSEKALPDVYGTYKKQLDEKQKQEDNRVAQKVQRVIGWWQSRKGWYDRDFSSILKEKHRANWCAPYCIPVGVGFLANGFVQKGNDNARRESQGLLCELRAPCSPSRARSSHRKDDRS